MKLKQHVPSYIFIADKDALISYDGQPPTCYRCNEMGHQQIECPHRKRLDLPVIDRLHLTWADIVPNMSQAVQPDISPHRTNKMHGSKTGSFGRSLDNTTDTKRLMNPQGLQGTSEEMEMGEYQLAHEHKEQYTPNTDPCKWTQNSSRRDETLTTINIECDKTDSQYDTEKTITHSTLSDKDMPVMGSHAEELDTKIHSSGIHLSTRNQSVGVTPEVELVMTPYVQSNSRQIETIQL